MVLSLEGGLEESHVSGQLIVEIHKVGILRQNKCCNIPTPLRLNCVKCKDKYWINRIP